MQNKTFAKPLLPWSFLVGTYACPFTLLESFSLTSLTKGLSLLYLIPQSPTTSTYRNGVLFQFTNLSGIIQRVCDATATTTHASGAKYQNC